uniref:Myosin phosphatase Rho interacting protein n=1 Tax=Myripristis murdjan TaxID=586833 RepID=A0A667XL02_9TELE
MSSKDNPCRKFQANIFNKSKCQNCFKPRESHLLNDEDLNQAKPIYGGWLLLAPEGTNFDNPLHRSRKWQRRFFILYEHGLLRYALDEMPSTLPQGTINMNQCSDVIDGESRTGQKNSLCILTPDKEHFIRAECKEIINGWQEALTVYPRTNKQNQKKKRKVEPPTHQEPGPAKVTVTSSGGSIPCLPSSIASAERVPASRASLWQEEGRWSRATIPCSRSAKCLCAHDFTDGSTMSSGRKVRVESGYFSLEKTKSEPSAQPAQPSQPPQHLPLSSSASSSSLGAPHRYNAESDPHTSPYYPSPDSLPSPGSVSSVGGGGGRVGRSGREYAALSDVPRARRLSYREAFRSEKKRQELRARTRSPGREEVARLFGEERRRSQVIERFEDGQHVERMDTSSSTEPSANTVLIQRQGRSERRYLANKQLSITDNSVPIWLHVTSQLYLSDSSSLQPDLLNFKKGWMTKLYEDGMWKKHWFVLTDQSLKYYKDSIAEEASDPDGEIDLSTCYDVTEFPVQRNYGFQILCKEGACTLSAMTSGIRRNWIQAIMKNVRPTIAPDVTRSLPEEKVKAQVVLEPCTQPSPEPSGNSVSVPASELRKSRVRERRREGRSKTYDWSEFKGGQTEKPMRNRAETVDLSSPSSSSTASSSCSSSSSPSSPGSYPLSTASSPQTSSVSSSQPPSVATTEEADKERARCAPHTGSRTTDVQIEIEHRWHQVETTPLREEKQVPITSAIGNSVTSDRLPPHELAALLDKELGQKQKELDRLQEQNNLLQEQLEDARGREQSAREGYVLQVPLPWQRLHKLNQDLQGELEAQKHKQDLAQQQVKTLKRSYTEAQDAVRHHEADIQALQSKLASAMAEIVASERAVARMRNELKLEQERSREQEEDWGHSEATLRAQLRDSEDRLREVEASLLERNQALRHLEHQQALQRDHLREVQRLQERLQEVTARLTATEEGQALKEERLRNEQHSMQESHERERQTLSRRLAEAITARKEMEDKLLEAEQQVEALLRGRQASGGKEDRVEVLKLQEELAQKTDMVETLRESVRRLEEEKGQLTCHCQELLNQIAEADREVNKLRSRLETEEADYYTLEHSYERASEEFQKMSQFLKEKEEEIRQTKEMYERLVERKEEDLKEALVKMTALGNSLEETEQKLQAKEELLCQMSHSVLDKVEPCSAERDLQAKLVVAEDRIAELEQHLNALHLGYAELSLAFDTRSKTNTSSDGKESQAKRPRIRFSSIQCQKYISLEGLDTSNVSSTFKDSQSQKLSQDVSQDIHSTEESSTSDITFHYASDPEKFISIIHALETKLLATEDKLRTLTQNLKEQKGGKAEDLPKSDLKETDNKPHQEKEPSFGTGCQINAASIEYAKALECVETSREKVRAILSGSHGTTDLQLHSLSEIENELFNATLYIKQGEKTLEENSLQVQQNQTQETLNSRELDEDTMHLFAKTLSFEAVVLNKMALLIQNSESDLLQGLAKIQEDIKSIKRDEEDYLAIVYADVLTRKLMLESAFWKELEKIETQFEHSDVAKSREGKVSSGTDIDATVILNTFFKAELAYSFQNLKHFYEEKFRTLKRELTESLQNAQDSLAHELQRQASILHRYAQEIESGGSHPEVASMIRALAGHQATHNFTSSSLCMREALIQAQVAYVACRLRAIHERDLGQCQQAGQHMDALVKEHAHNVSAIQEKYEASLQEERLSFTQTVDILQKENHTLKNEISKRVNQLSQQQEQLSHLEKHFQKETEELRQKHKQELSQAEQGRASTELVLMETTADSQRKLEVLLLDMDTMEERHEGHVRKLQEQFQERISELQHIHKEEIQKLHAQYMDTIRCIQEHQQGTEVPEISFSLQHDEATAPMEEEEQGKGEEEHTMCEVDPMVVLKDRIQELETQMNTMRDELENKHLEGDVASLREKYQRDFESLKATCERGFAAMEETHQKVIEDLQRQHQREVSKLMEERERLLAEETAATIAAIEAMKNAHKEELEKTQRSQLSGLNSDIDELRLQYEEELQSVQRELEVLSEQYSQKCLENAHLAQALEAERQALRQCQRENQELNAHNQELNNRLTAEITRMRSCFSGETAMSPLTQGKDVYELEVLLRIKESEIQYLKQEIHSLKDELQSALRDKKYATDKYKDIYTELSIVKAKADCDISKLKEKLLVATEALGERTVDGAVTPGYDIMKSKSNPDFMKKERSANAKQTRGVRSKVRK